MRISLHMDQIGGAAAQRDLRGSSLFCLEYFIAFPMCIDCHRSNSCLGIADRALFCSSVLVADRYLDDPGLCAVAFKFRDASIIR